MSLGNFLGKIGRIFGSPAMREAGQAGAALVGLYNPGLGALAELIANAVYSVESEAAAGASGPEKKTQVQAIVDLSAPVTLAVLAGVAGKPVADPGALAPAIGALIDDVVALFNALGVFGHARAAAPPV